MTSCSVIRGRNYALLRVSSSGDCHHRRHPGFRWGRVCSRRNRENSVLHFPGGFFGFVDRSLDAWRNPGLTFEFFSNWTAKFAALLFCYLELDEVGLGGSAFARAGNKSYCFI